MAAGGRRGLAQLRLPGRGQFWHVAWPPPGGADHSFTRLVPRHLVLPTLGGGNRDLIFGRPLVSGEDSGKEQENAAPSMKMGNSRALQEKDRNLCWGTLLVLIFSKYFYLSGIGSYYTFYLITKFGVSVRSAQLHLFLFQFAVAAGTMIGGPLGDRIGAEIRNLGLNPWCCAFHAGTSLRGPASNDCSCLPYWLILASAFPSILVYAQEPSGAHFWSLFRVCLRYGRGRIGSPRHNRRPYKHPARLQAHGVSSAHGLHRPVPAQP